jgi:hypothetical protein
MPPAEQPESADAAGLPYAIILAFRAEHDPREAPGIGGHATALAGAYSTFQLSAIVREFGFRATRESGLDAEQAAAAAGMGSIDASGRLRMPKLGTKVHIADVIHTDLPVAPEAWERWPRLT